MIHTGKSLMYIYLQKFLHLVDTTVRPVSQFHIFNMSLSRSNSDLLSSQDLNSESLIISEQPYTSLIDQPAAA
jgi:hypothetical protein